jgi:hypothetical protein
MWTNCLHTEKIAEDAYIGLAATVHNLIFDTADPEPGDSRLDL